MSKNKKFTIAEEALFSYLYTYDDDDLPDRAWKQMIKDGIESYNEEYETDFDPDDYFVKYVTYKANID